MKRTFTILMLIVLATTAHAEGNHYVGTATSSDGSTIAYEAWGKGKPAIVFVHGWSCDRTYWQDQIEFFAADHQVVAIDLAGHGESGAERTDYTMAAFGDDVAVVLERHGITDAVLVGHSMGGPVVVEAALLVADRVRGVIGVDNFQSMKEEFPPDQVAAFTGALTANFVGTVEPWVRSMFPAGADSALVGEVARDMASAPPAVALSAMDHTLAWMGGGGVPRLEKMFTNLVCVNDDQNPTNIEENRTVVPGFSATIMKGAGHFPMRTRPDEFNALLAEAVAGFARPGAPGELR